MDSWKGMGPTYYSEKLASSRFPEYGAIFISNNSTRNECFDRRLFGLPYDKAYFVESVKKGMVLFLYDYEDRKMYGVFEASTDGAMEIVPDAYMSRFPAQVRFSVLRRCAPVPNHEFRDAIKENFYAPNKFNFGLSRDQVLRLLLLFDDSKFEIPCSPMKKLLPERQNQKVSSVSESSVGSLTDSMPRRLGSLAVCDRELNVDVEDYIPLSFTNSNESEDNINTYQFEADSATSQPLSEAGASLSQLDKSVGGFEISNGSDIDDPIDESIRYQAQGFELESSMPTTCFAGSESSHEHKGDEKMKGASVYKTGGMYSDIGNKGSSVFHRLGGWPEMKVKKNSNSIWWKDILNNLDQKYEQWHRSNTSGARILPYGGFKCKGNDTLAGKGRKRNRISGECTGGILQETKTCYESLPVPESSQGSAVGARISKAPQISSNDASSINDTVNFGEQQPACPLLWEDDKKSEDPVEMLMKQYREYLCKSFRVKDQAEEMSGHLNNRDNLEVIHRL